MLLLAVLEANEVHYGVSWCHIVRSGVVWWIWFVGWLVGWFAVRALLIVWLDVGQLEGWFVGAWLVCWLAVGLLLGWLARWVHLHPAVCGVLCCYMV